MTHGNRKPDSLAAGNVDYSPLATFESAPAKARASAGRADREAVEIDQDADQIQQEIESFRERVFELYDAVLRTGSSLDLTTDPQVVVDSTRSLTAAVYGVIPTVDKAGRPQEFVSYGIKTNEERNLAE